MFTQDDNETMESGVRFHTASFIVKHILFKCNISYTVLESRA